MSGWRDRWAILTCLGSLHDGVAAVISAVRMFQTIFLVGFADFMFLCR